MPRQESPKRRVLLPEGELRRFRLPEATAEARPAPIRKRRGWVLLLGLWLLFSAVCFQWSEGNLSLRSWVNPFQKREASQKSKEEPEVTHTRLTTPGGRATAGAAPSSTVPADLADLAQVVAGPRAPALSKRPEVPTHQKSWNVGAGRAAAGFTEEMPQPEVEEPRREGRAQAHAGPGCEGARVRVGVPLAETPHPETTRLIQRRSLYQDCRVPEMSVLNVCVLVQAGRARGVTVEAEPPSKRVATCAAVALMTLGYPKQPQPQMVRAEVVFH